MAPLGATWLTKLGRCDSYTMEWLNNRTARLLGLLRIQAQIARIHLAPLGSSWLHMGPLGYIWLHLVPTCFYWFSTDFYWLSTNFYWPSTDSLLDCFRSAMCLNNWEQLGTFKATWCMDWIWSQTTTTVRAPLSGVNNKALWNPKNICVTTFLGHCNNKYLNFTFLQHFTKLLQPIHIVTSFIRCNNIVTTIICCNDIVT